MSEEQLKALMGRLEQDADLRTQLSGITDLNTFIEIINATGVELSKAEWLRFQAQNLLELNDHDLETVAGGKSVSPDFTAVYTDQCLCR